jgi:hypothetical protein
LKLQAIGCIQSARNWRVGAAFESFPEISSEKMLQVQTGFDWHAVVCAFTKKATASGKKGIS